MKKAYFKTVLYFIHLLLFTTSAETVYYSLENVMLDDGTQMTGLFSWNYTVGDFENGTKEFIFLEIPHTGHNQNDLITTIEPSQIEITFETNAHDEGLDIKLVLQSALTPTTSSLINTNTAESKYSIGGNGFNKGFFLGGSISPTNVTVNIAPDLPGFSSLSWGPDIPGFVLQETTNLSSNWSPSASGSTNPVVLPSSAPALFFRVVKP